MGTGVGAPCVDPVPILRQTVENTLSPHAFIRTRHSCCAADARPHRGDGAGVGRVLGGQRRPAGPDRARGRRRARTTSASCRRRSPTRRRSARSSSPSTTAITRAACPRTWRRSCCSITATGALIAVIDGRYITEARTAAVSAVSVAHLARAGRALARDHRRGRPGAKPSRGDPPRPAPDRGPRLEPEARPAARRSRGRCPRPPPCRCAPPPTAAAAARAPTSSCWRRRRRRRSSTTTTSRRARTSSASAPAGPISARCRRRSSRGRASTSTRAPAHSRKPATCCCRSAKARSTEPHIAGETRRARRSAASPAAHRRTRRHDLQVARHGRRGRRRGAARRRSRGRRRSRPAIRVEQMTAVSSPRAAGRLWIIVVCTAWLLSGALTAVVAQSPTTSISQPPLDATIQRAYDAVYNLDTGRGPGARAQGRRRWRRTSRERIARSRRFSGSRFFSIAARSRSIITLAASPRPRSARRRRRRAPTPSSSANSHARSSSPKRGSRRTRTISTRGSMPAPPTRCRRRTPRRSKAA